MKTSLLLILMISIMACDPSTDGSQAILLRDEIPNIEVLEDDARFSMSTDGTIYLDSIKFSGYVVSYYPERSVKSKKGYYQGRLEGDFISYYPNGQIYSQRPYHLGEKHGEHLGYYEDGQLKFQYQFVNGFSQGTHKNWYASGKLKKEMNYKDGKEFGPQKYWRPDGKMRSNYVVRENGRRYGMLGLKRCAKIDSETGDIDPYTGNLK
ncbi:MAG: toxin-antitoxin system YwqK family antitoxin [Reichenbachiella sp.]|uniref:toxin-antitoxin system YwqK family antitoxin n=1 Tax=Reichenbachiella sp. TaxID=2184521 RepID=UPI003297138B